DQRAGGVGSVLLPRKRRHLHPGDGRRQVVQRVAQHLRVEGPGALHVLHGNLEPAHDVHGASSRLVRRTLTARHPDRETAYRTFLVYVWAMPRTMRSVAAPRTIRVNVLALHDSTALVPIGLADMLR